MRQEILIAGSGGQGVITASIILAEAAALYEGYHVVQCQSYGPEARGGASNSNVILNKNEEVGYPKVVQPQYMVCLTQESLDKYSGMLRPGGLMLTDSTQVRRLRQLDGRVYNLDMLGAVKDRIGMPIVFNICMLGAFVGLTGLVQLSSVRAALQTRVPARFLGQNTQALELGMELAEHAGLWRADQAAIRTEGGGEGGGKAGEGQPPVVTSCGEAAC